MPSKFTENYNLNQWEPEDKVQRTDFNEDNAKLDEALTAHDAAIRNAHPVLLKTWTSGEAAKTLELDISGIEWAKYAWVVLEVCFPEQIRITMDINGGGHFYSSSGAGSSSNFYVMVYPANLFRMFCPVFYRDDLPLQSLTLETFSVASISNLPIRELKLLTLNAVATYISPSKNSPSTITAGTEFKIWGIQ